MRKALLLLSMAVACTLSPVASDECCATTGANVEQQLHNIDLKIALKKYEHVQTERAKTQIELIILQTDASLDDSERDRRARQLQNRIEIFTAHADELRAQILKMSKATSVAAR